MKSILAAAVVITTSVLGQNVESIPGPVYDRDGRMLEYHYSDGTKEAYAYDSSSRMTRFTDRTGGITTFVYSPEGSMTTIMPDGTIRN